MDRTMRWTDGLHYKRWVNTPLRGSLSSVEKNQIEHIAVIPTAERTS
jgi:hypothetical protein